MSKSPALILFLLLSSSLLLITLALSPVSQGNYFYVPFDNHLSYELYQTRNGTIAHSIELINGNSYISRYSLINLEAKDAIPILSDLVSNCDNANPTFQSLHYHNQTDSLVYYCAKNTSLLVLSQQDHTVQQKIPLNLQISSPPPVAKLSTDGATIVAILLMDTLFTQSPQSSVLLKVDLQTKTVSTQIMFNQNLTTNEAVVAYAANKNHTYIATNRLQGATLTTTVYSIVLAGNTYQLTQIATFNSSTLATKIITKLFTLEDYIIVNNGAELNFLNQQGTVVQSTQIKIKALTSQPNGLSHPAVTAQSNGANLYVIRTPNSFGIYSVINNTIQLKDFQVIYEDFQIAFGNPATPGGDLIFAIGGAQIFFYIVETKTFQTVYTAISGYADIMLTDTTYAVVRTFNPNSKYSFNSGYIFDLKKNVFLKRFDLFSKYYYNKDQRIITLLNTMILSGCLLVHIDIVAAEQWNSMEFARTDPICSSEVVSARITENGDPEVVFQLADHYEIISETYGRKIFPFASPTDSINVNFDDLSLYYLSANQAANQITASLYGINSTTNNFSRISSNTFNNRPVEDQGFFTINQNTTVALSDKTFTFITQLNSSWNQDNFYNNYNMVTAFEDSSKTQFAFFGYNNSYNTSKLINSDGPVLFSDSQGFIEIPNKRVNTVNARATGTNSFALHDVLYSNIGVVRFCKFDSTEKKTISI